MNAELRDYQADGFKWLRRLSEWGVGGILADDMGLGKTVQTLAVLVDRAHRGPSLVIAPTSVGFNWLREIQRFAPHLTVHSYRDTDRNEFFQDSVRAHRGLFVRLGFARRRQAEQDRLEQPDPR